MYLILTAAALYGLGLIGGRAGRNLVAAGMVIHVGHLLHRGLKLGWFPITERMDIFSFISVTVMVLYLILQKFRPARSMEFYFIPMGAFFAFVSILYQPVNAVDVFMESGWFYVFSTLNIIAYALLSAGTAYGISYVFNDDEEAESLQHRLTLYGWAAFSASLLAGSVWFFLSYGSYWYWTAKEFWSSLVWLYYGIYLHSRYMGNLRGRPAGLIGLLGYPVLLFNYFGIGTIIQSPWSQF